MNKISLTQGKVALVDDEDYERLIQFKWHYNKEDNTAQRSYGILIHREIINAPDLLQVDHKDGNGLNNQRSNLRICTHAQNSMNRSPKCGCSSIYKGVCWNKELQKWYSYIKFEQHLYNLGHFKDERQAVLFYDITAVHFFREFARLNFPEYVEFIKDYWKGKELYGTI